MPADELRGALPIPGTAIILEKINGCAQEKGCRQRATPDPELERRAGSPTARGAKLAREDPGPRFTRTAAWMGPSRRDPVHLTACHVGIRTRNSCPLLLRPVQGMGCAV